MRLIMVSLAFTLLTNPSVVLADSASSGPDIDETVKFIEAQLSNCETRGNSSGPGGEALELISRVKEWSISREPNGVSGFTEVVTAGRVGASPSQRVQYTYVFRLKYFDPTPDTKNDDNIGTEHIRFNCAEKACVLVKTGSGSTYINAVTFPGCSGGQKDRLARALSRAIQLMGGKKSAF